MIVQTGEQIVTSHTYGAFSFEGHRLEAETGTIFLSYRFLPDGPAFEEKIILGPSGFATAAHVAALTRLLPLLHVAAGISYFKAYVPPMFEGAHLTAQQAAFFTSFYREGLGEFALRNGLSFDDHRFFEGVEPAQVVENISLPERAMVLVGGGKDSLVSIETLRAGGDELSLFAVNPAKPIRACIEASGLPSLSVKRVIDPALFDENAKGAYNGHVPITGIISFVAAAAALWHGYDSIVLSNERSANEATVDGANHQYSKSQDFESAFIGLLHTSVTPSLHYYSLLRPLSEVGIARLFAKEERYDDVFSSCNKSYSVTNPMTDKRWCGECPKCLFVFLSLATAVSPERLVRIFGGQNLLDTPALEHGYRELCGLAGQKPWECVGEILESAAALYHLSGQDVWKDAALVRDLRDDLVSKYGQDVLEEEYRRAQKFADAPTLPEPSLKKLKQYANA